MRILTKALEKLRDQLVPVRYRTILNPRWDNESIADRLDVDTLHTIIDEARDGDTRRLFAVYRDLVLAHSHGQSELNTRKLAVVGEPTIIEPYDKDEPDSNRAREIIETLWDDCDDSLSATTHLLDACLWPVSVVEKTFRPSRLPGIRFEIAGLKPVPYQLLDYREGFLRIRDVLPDGRAGETFHLPDPSRYIIHRGHLLTSIPDTFGGPIRAALFWWLFSAMDRDWWIRFLERFGSPFMVGKYDPSDEGARSLLAQAFSAATRLFGLTVSKDTQVEVHSVATASHGDAFESFQNVANKELSKLILGQTMTSEAQAAGLGSNQAEVHDRVRGDIRQFDSLTLAHTLRGQLFRQLLQINGLNTPPPLIRWGSDKQDAKLLADTLSTLSTAGLQPTSDSLGELGLILGFPVERKPQQEPGGFLPLSAFAATPGAVTTHDRLARQTARRYLASISPTLSEALATADNPEAFMAHLKLPTDARAVEELLITEAANALLR